VSASGDPRRTNPTVLVRGDGVAACCCAHLLSRFGLRVGREPVSRRRLPALLLSRASLDLIRDVFQEPDLFSGLPLIQERIVQWGAEANPVPLEHSAVVVSEEDLLDRLGPASVQPVHDPDWTIFASDPVPACATVNRFGERSASVTPVALAGGADPSACCIESTEAGWLFLIPAAPGRAWLLSVGGSPLEESRLIARRIARCEAPSGQFGAAPRLLSPLCGPGWLACGTAAMAFDPLCGDGTAHAIREAILACAVIRAIAAGGDPASLLEHYTARLTAGFERHLSICLQFYCSGGGGPWWKAQSDATAGGIDWCARQTRDLPPFRYRLSGFDLVPVPPA
jgi:hypothetical protein